MIMSQVTIRDDRPKDILAKTSSQERAIDTSSAFSPWRHSDATKTLAIEKLIATFSIPLWFLGISLLFVVCLGFSLSLLLFRSISMLVSIKKYK
jgi:hypothetical protein